MREDALCLWAIHTLVEVVVVCGNGKTWVRRKLLLTSLLKRWGCGWSNSFVVGVNAEE